MRLAAVAYGLFYLRLRSADEEESETERSLRFVTLSFLAADASANDSETTTTTSHRPRKLRKLWDRVDSNDIEKARVVWTYVP